MSILRKSEIQKEIEAGRIIIDPYFPESVKAASVELLLSNRFGKLRKQSQPVISSKFSPENEAVDWETAVNTIEIPPAETRVGTTKEKISLPDDIVGWITPRGKTALLGLNIQISTGFVQPGTRDEELFFLMTNIGKTDVSLLIDSKLCQLIFFKL